MKKNRKYLLFVVAACFCLFFLAGCGNGDEIKEETKQLVNEKTEEVLTLYADIEKLVQDNELEADKTFSDMKTQLTEMSAEVKQQIEDTTETDGRQAAEKLDEMITNLQNVKAKVEKSLE